MQSGAYRAAIQLYEAILDETPDDTDVLNDAALAYAQEKDWQKAETYLRRALDSRPDFEAAFYNLLDVLIEARKDPDALEAFEDYAADIPDSADKLTYRQRLGRTPSAYQGDGAPTKHRDTDTLRIAFVCGPDRKFITDIEREIGKRHEVRTAYFDSEVNLQQIQRVMDWGDVIWFEWCDKILAHASHKLRKTSRVVCRLHSYEALSNLPQHVDWEFVDKIVLVSSHMEDIFIDRFPQVAAAVPIEVIPNGIDLDCFPFTERSPGHDIAYVGYLNHKKNPSLLLQCLHALVQEDDRYHLHVAGVHQEPRYEIYWNHMLNVLNLQNHITMNGWVEDISSWLDGKQYLVSTSVHESFGYGIAEAMARGIKPIIHHFQGADKLFPPSMLFRTIPEFADLIQSDNYESKSYRQHVANRYPLGRQVNSITKLLERLTNTPYSQNASPKRSFPGSQSYWEWRYEQGGNSGAGSYGRLADFKAEIINDFVARNAVQSLIEFGCGDGNQLSLSEYPSYVGLDVSEKAVQMCRDRFSEDDSKEFYKYSPDDFDPTEPLFQAELALSLDVIFHLVEDQIFELYMEHLFESAERYVIIYSSNTAQQPPNLSPHVRFRRFTDWIETNRSRWELIQKIPNRYPLQEDSESESFSDFYIYKNASINIAASCL
jgi:glycosyltransferase involved in cell wall biosynthesis